MPLIVSTHSYRGGTGKSNVTANLAAALASRGKRVAVVDTDIQSPGIHVLFRQEPEAMTPTLNNYLWGHCRIAETAHDVTAATVDGQGACAVPAGGALFLIPSSIKAGEIARILKEGYDVNLLNDGFQELLTELQLDLLLIDTHPGLNEETLLSLAISDALVLLLRPDQQDYQGTAVTLEVARRLDVPNLMVAINKALPSLDFATLRDRVSRLYKAPVAAVLPLSEDLMAMGSSGLFSLHSPSHAWAQGIHSLADQVLGARD